MSYLDHFKETVSNMYDSITKGMIVAFLMGVATGWLLYA